MSIIDKPIEDLNPPEARSAPVLRPRAGRLIQFVQAYALLLVGIAVALFFSVWSRTSDVFPTAANLRILVASQAVLGVVAIGALIPLIAGEFDLSVGPVAALSAVSVAQAFSTGWPLLVCLAVGVVVGVSVGLFHAIVVTRFNVNAVVTTLGSGTILLGVIRHRTGGLAPPSDIADSVVDFGTGRVLGIPLIFLAMLAIAFVAFFLLEHTPFGRQLYGLGSNPEAARLVGLNTRRLRGLALVCGSVACGIGGILYVARAGGADPKIANTFTLPALAAAFLSAASVRPGTYNVWGAIVAIYFIAVLNNGLNLAGAETYMSDYLNGGALIVGVALAVALRQRSERA